MVNDPRYLNIMQDVRLARGGVGFNLEEIGEIKGAGTSTSDLASSGSTKNWIEFYTETTDTSGADSRVAELYMAVNAAAGSAVAAQFRGEITCTSAATGAGGADAWGELAATAAMPTGLLYGMCAAVIADARASATTLTGTYWALFLASSFGENITTSAQSAFIGFQDWGSGDAMPQLLDLSGLTAGTGNALEVDSGAVGTVYGYLHVRTPAGQGYIPVYSDHS